MYVGRQHLDAYDKEGVACVYVFTTGIIFICLTGAGK